MDREETEVKALRSKRYLAASKGETCKLMIPGVCTGDRETVVPCHIRDIHTGKGIKASDISVVDGCHACHEVFDRRAKHPDGGYLSEMDWLFYALRGLQLTLEARVAAGILGWPADAERPPVVKKSGVARKSKAIPSRPMGKSARTIPSRPFQRGKP